MIVAEEIAALHSAVELARRATKRIVFVPTMGNLHPGHLRLMTSAREHGDFVAASIYVNPLQFGPDEDFADYPRTPARDLEMLSAHGVDLAFLPDDEQVYPRGRAAQTRVEVPYLGDILCGQYRPGHFQGVATVVARLFNLVAPDAVVLGKKDYQQLLIIRLMVSDLGMPIEVIGIDTVRDNDGLALSSRNQYLSVDERARAPLLYGSLNMVAGKLVRTRPPFTAIENEALNHLRNGGFNPDYVSVRRQSDLAQPGEGDHNLVILAAARLGRVRLIDNLEINLNPGR